MDPRELLPPECWELVFDKVKDPQDWLNLYRSSPVFQELLLEKRTTALFPQVFPNVLEFLGEELGDILALRLVSRPWKAAVDKTLEEGMDSKCVSNSRSTRRREIQHSYYFRNPARISSFLEQFDLHSGNPFVGRFASFRYDNSQSSEANAKYKLLAARLLDKFGTQLKSLDHLVFRTNFVNCEARLRSYLLLAPNLDSLSVHYCTNYMDRRAQHEQVEPYIEREEGGGNPLPLPLLSNLKSISFSASSGGLAGGRGLLDLQNAVVRLSCSPASLKSVKTVGVPSELLTFPNVDSADVDLADAHSVDGMVEEAYSNLAIASWPLSKLTLWQPFLQDNIEPLFECLKNFRATLTHLRVRRPLLQRNPLRKLKLLLDLPQLQELTIDEHPRMSLGIFTGLKNLKVLAIRHNRNLLHNAEEEYDGSLIGHVQAEVARWGLWEELPKLRQIVLLGPILPDTRIAGYNNGTLMMRLVATRIEREFQRKENQRFLSKK